MNGPAKIGNFEIAVGIHKDVFGFEVAVDDVYGGRSGWERQGDDVG